MHFFALFFPSHKPTCSLPPRRGNPSEPWGKTSLQLCPRWFPWAKTCLGIETSQDPEPPGHRGARGLQHPPTVPLRHSSSPQYSQCGQGAPCRSQGGEGIGEPSPASNQLLFFKKKSLKQRKTLSKKLLGKEERWNPHHGWKSSVGSPIY